MIFIVTGPVHSGKTTLVKKILKILKEQNVSVNGFLSERVSRDQEIDGYDLFSLKTGKSRTFIRKKPGNRGERVGPYFLNPQVLAEAKKIILKGKESDILVIDEVGPLELSGRGFWPALEEILRRPPKLILLVIREEIFGDFLERIKDKEVKVFEVKEKEVLVRINEEIKASL